MKWFILFLTIVLCLPLFSVREKNNDFYDNTPSIQLKGPDIEVKGEISNPGKVDFSELPLRSLIVREAVFQDEKQVFIGSYRYQGYSLFDILKERFVDKRNKEEFGSVIDLLVVVENTRGEKTVFSWGEIYYPSVLHRIIVATRVSRIIPSKTKEKWPLPEKIKLVCANDMMSERNLENPIKITVYSSPLSFKIRRNLKTRYSGKMNVIQNHHKRIEIDHLDENLEGRTYPSVFYGRGRGFHGIQFFKGKLLKSLLHQTVAFNRKNIRSGYFVVSAVDGYRVVISFSELFNRNDQVDFLIIDKGEGSKKGRFRLFPAPDFFSDRAVHTIDSIFFRQIK